mmetsp:Transcript_124087/g.351327  ORF Transcript_124087/g.351327 Transcript_124087/m.351327 type:complete len:278 (-) Transcript_124087:20-853(-)
MNCKRFGDEHPGSQTWVACDVLRVKEGVRPWASEDAFQRELRTEQRLRIHGTELDVNSAESQYAPKDPNDPHYDEHDAGVLERFPRHLARRAPRRGLEALLHRPLQLLELPAERLEVHHAAGAVAVLDEGHAVGPPPPQPHLGRLHADRRRCAAPCELRRHRQAADGALELLAQGARPANVPLPPAEVVLELAPPVVAPLLEAEHSPHVQVMDALTERVEVYDDAAGLPGLLEFPLLLAGLLEVLRNPARGVLALQPQPHVGLARVDCRNDVPGERD